MVRWTSRCKGAPGDQGPDVRGNVGARLNQDLRDRCENPFQAPQGDAMILFMWQGDIIGVARFIDACLERVCTSAGPPVRDQASD